MAIGLQSDLIETNQPTCTAGDHGYLDYLAVSHSMQELVSISVDLNSTWSPQYGIFINIDLEGMDTWITTVRKPVPIPESDSEGEDTK